MMALVRTSSDEKCKNPGKSPARDSSIHFKCVPAHLRAARCHNICDKQGESEGERGRANWGQGREEPPHPRTQTAHARHLKRKKDTDAAAHSRLPNIAPLFIVRFME
jgi:hypothetical protein